MKKSLQFLGISLLFSLSGCGGGAGAASSAGSAGVSDNRVLVSGVFSDSLLSDLQYSTDDIAYIKIRKAIGPFVNLLMPMSVAADASYQCYNNQNITIDITANGYSASKTMACDSNANIQKALRIALIPAINGETLKKTVSIDGYTMLDTVLNYVGGLTYNLNYYSVYKLGTGALPCYEAVKLQVNGTGQVVKGDIPTAHELGDGSHCPVAQAYQITYRYRDGGIDIDLSGSSNYDSVGNASNFERWEIQ